MIGRAEKSVRWFIVAGSHYPGGPIQAKPAQGSASGRRGTRTRRARRPVPFTLPGTLLVVLLVEEARDVERVAALATGGRRRLGMTLGAPGNARHALEQRAPLATGPRDARLIGAGPLIRLLGRRSDRIGLDRRRQDIVFLELQLVFLELDPACGRGAGRAARTDIDPWRRRRRTASTGAEALASGGVVSVGAGSGAGAGATGGAATGAEARGREVEKAKGFGAASLDAEIRGVVGVDAGGDHRDADLALRDRG